MKTETTEKPTLPESKLVRSQTKKFGPKSYTEHGDRMSITATVRYDDQCGNGHNSFSITAEIRRNGREDSGGCCHDEVAKHFPELSPLIKWHLTSSDGPMHYIANTVYHAGARDHWGLLKGEKRQLRYGGEIPCWRRVMRNKKGEEVGSSNYGDNPGHVHSEEKPTEELTAAWEPEWIVGEGKERNLNAARSCAVWPEATDEDLTAPGLEQRLADRLPALMQEFKAAIESLGFTY